MNLEDHASLDHFMHWTNFNSLPKFLFTCIKLSKVTLITHCSDRSKSTILLPIIFQIQLKLKVVEPLVFYNDICMVCRYTWSNLATGIKSSTCSTDTNRWMLHSWQSSFSYPCHYHMMYSCNCNSSVFSKEHLHQFMWHWDNPGMDDVLIIS